MNDDILNSLPISEDDIILNLRYHVVFFEKNALVSFQEDWVMKPILKHFKNYTCNNSLRIKEIKALNNQALLFDFKQISPDISLEDMASGILSHLEDALTMVHIKISDDFWEKADIFSVGAEDDAITNGEEYVKRLRKCRKKRKSVNDNTI